MHNLFAQFRELLPKTALQVGEITAIEPGSVLVTLPGSGSIRARSALGSVTVGQKVFVRDGVVESLAPSLPIEVIDV